METAMISGLDPASFSSVIKPGDDLFRYVNGPWIDTYRLPDDRSRFGSFDKLAQDAEEQIRDILEDDHCPAAKSQALYRSFCDTQTIERNGIEPIKADLQAIDDVADKADLTRLLGSLNPVGGPDLFGIGIYGDPGDPDTNIIHIEQSGLGLPDEAYYREERYAPIREQYAEMVARQLLLAGYGDKQETKQQAARFLDTETRIAAQHWDNVATRDSQKTYNPTDYAALSAALQHFDVDAWAKAWQETYDATAAARSLHVDMIAALQHTIAHEPSFLTGLDEFWNSADLEDLKLWARAHTLIGWAGMLSHDFDQTNFDFYGKVLSGTTQQRDRWKRGVSLVNGICGEDVGREYVKRHFPESSKERMEQLVGNLIAAYRVSIANSDWLGEATKGKALEKLAKFTPKIGYTQHWRDYSALDLRDDAGLIGNMRAASLYESGYQLSKAGKPVDKDEWLMNPQTVNAYYEPSLNVIVFPAAILQPPFFDPQAEDAANYGGIGSVIGHEIGHGFDDQGSKYDGDGKLNDWWTAEDRKNFEALTSRLIEQYNGFVPSQLADKYADDPSKAPHVNGALTIGENIGDLSGVNIALKAYAFALDEAAGRPVDGSQAAIERTLEQAPRIDGFTGLQRFFLSYASVWRSTQRDELAEQYLQIDPHSPAEFRTNGITRNVDLFYTAFGVDPENRMWLDPEQRVHIW
ncbi:M13 family metallopeptidase [Bifidobacterium subtile]|jgi:putative endopeptidase|nr:M13-type metalloendopeptidase [Bifidobacterium subtile]MCI1240629.1 peptidase M13 [Bifidobacterium subtile]MCI1258959.1 peptidase M13 [Bifidobacterium subtile]QOL36819.1 peptidase M13 [Bifidobacterium subtile]